MYAEAMDYLGAGSLDTFWRGAENFKTEATGYRSRESDNFIPGMMWAVSQVCEQLLAHHKVYSIRGTTSSCGHCASEVYCWDYIGGNF